LLIACETQSQNQTSLSTKAEPIMDSLKNAVGMGDNKETQPNQQVQGGGFLGGIGDKINSAAGGGKESEKNEDYLDKGI